VDIMNILGDYLGLIFLIVFVVLMVVLAVIGQRFPARTLREIPAFHRLRRAVGLAVEAGTRLHISIGRGNMVGMQTASALIGLTMLERIARAASISDQPPVATSGDGVLAILTQDTLHKTYRNIGAESRYELTSGRLTGVTPFSYAAGAMPIIREEQVSANVLAGHFGSEVALIAEAGERSGSLTIAGSDSLSAQAILFAAAQEPLIGEELFAGGAYLGAGALHAASLHTQDILRWVLVLVMVIGAILKIAGVL